MTCESQEIATEETEEQLLAQLVALSVTASAILAVLTDCHGTNHALRITQTP